MEPAPRCAMCSDAIGVYEPLLAIDRHSARPASLAREPELGERGEILVHRYCAPARDGRFGSRIEAE